MISTWGTQTWVVGVTLVSLSFWFW